jgi:hypothetical protein
MAVMEPDVLVSMIPWSEQKRGMVLGMLRNQDVFQTLMNLRFTPNPLEFDPTPPSPPPRAMYQNEHAYIPDLQTSDQHDLT